MLSLRARCALIVFRSRDFSTSARNWNGWNIDPDGYPDSVATDKFAELVNERSKARTDLKTVHFGVTGGQPDAIDTPELVDISHCLTLCKR